MNVNSEHHDEKDSVAQRTQGEKQHSYLKDFVYGAIDGTVTTFAVVTSIAGAGLDSELVIVLGMANLLGDGFSMAASNYLGTRTDKQLVDQARGMAQRQIRLFPDGERQEVRQVFASKGFKDSDLDRAVEIITSDEQRWIDTILVDELGLTLDSPNAITAATTTFLAFFLVGLLPLAAFAWGIFVPINSFWLYAASTLMTGCAFFFVGAAKSYFVDQKWYWSGMETLLIGGLAALLAYIVGLLLKGIIG